MSIIRDFTLYLNAGISTPEVVHVNQYDQGEVWRFTLLESDGSKYTPSTGALIGVKADGHAIAGVTGTVLGDGRVSITETQQMTAAAGDAIFELTIDGGSHGSANFIVRVEKKPTDDAILSESDLSIIQEGLNSVTPVVIAETVSDWLEDNLTNPPIDPSLTISNAAADAKVTGDKLTELKTAITTVSAYGTWEQGTPQDSTLGTRICCKMGACNGGSIIVTQPKPGYFFSIDVWANADYTNKISTTDFITNYPARYVFSVPENVYISLVIRRDNSGAVTPSDMTGYYLVEYWKTITDTYNERKTAIQFTDWKQGVPAQRQNANRVCLYCGCLENGTLKVTTAAGFQYGINYYPSAYYDSISSDSGWKQVTTEVTITNKTYVAIIGCRTNYGAVDSSDVLDKIIATFTRATDEAVHYNWQNINSETGLLSQNGIDETLTVPSYYVADNYIDGKIARINTLAQSCGGNGDTFAFITDMHWKLNAKKSPSLLNYLYHNTHINKLFGGGDYSDAKHADDTYFLVSSVLRDAWKGRAYYAIGNHEYLGNSGVYNTEQNLAYYYESYYGSEIVYGSMLRNYFYFNDNGNKIRYVFLNRYAQSTNGGTSSNDGLETAQLNWFQNVALNVETGWSIVVVIHSIYGFNIISDNTVQPFITEGSEALVNIIESYNGNGEIIAVVSGHSHMDIVMRLNNNIPVIITTCDKNKTGGETPVYSDYWADRADGTISEQAFDVMVINRESRTINAVRIGCPAMTWTQSGDNYIRGASTEERVITF